jgi:hypothetical protein
MDADGTVGRAYGARTTPHLYIVDPAGTLVYAGAIDSKPTANPADIARPPTTSSRRWPSRWPASRCQHASTRPYGCSVKYAGQ